MKGITAKIAKELATGAKSEKVEKLLTLCENKIAESAKEGYLGTGCPFCGYPTPVIEKVCDILVNERNFQKVTYCSSSISVRWGE